MTSLNLLRDPWIPVVMRDGSRHVIAAWQMADPNIAALDWPRMDLNIACLELLIGLVYLADPPEDDDDWAERRTLDPERLRERLVRFESAFNLLGEGPRFLQDLEPLSGEPSAPDMLFIDSAGESTEKNNADLMTWRARYPRLSLPMAAMVLYAFQAFAPLGGAGNRTSMRGGGPQTTLVNPGGSLWALIWANVPNGEPASSPNVLPWMQKTVVSSKGEQVWPQDRHPAEAFFGMPRRLRLIEQDGAITGVVQRPHGNNYAGWEHPLTPHYRMKVGAELLPRHPPAGVFGYRHWLGIVAADEKQEKDGLRQRAKVVRGWWSRSRYLDDSHAEVMVVGWAMSNMKPLDYSFSTAPLIELTQAAALSLPGLVEAADQFALALRQALRPVLAEGEAREAVREEFFIRSQADFEARVRELQQGHAPAEVSRRWRDVTQRLTLGLFDTQALPGLSERDPKEQQDIVTERQRLLANLRGHGKYGKQAYAALDLPPETKNTLQEEPAAS